MSGTLTRDDCATIEAIAVRLADPDGNCRAAAALDFSEALETCGTSVAELLRFRREWGGRPDLGRSCAQLSRHVAGEVLGVGEGLGWSDEALEALEIAAVAEGRPHPADMLRVMGLFAVAMGSLLDPDTPTLPTSRSGPCSRDTAP